MENSPCLFVLIHGGQVGTWVWDSVRSQLILPSIAVDLPGHGQRSRDELKDLSIAQCVDTVLESIPAKGGVVLVGHSMGGAIALALADRIPERVVHLVIVAGMVPMPGKSLMSSFPLVMQMLSSVLLRFTSEFAQPARIVKVTLLNGLPSDVADDLASRFSPESASLFFDPVEWRPNTARRTTYIRCLRDKGALSPSFQEKLAARLGPAVTVMTVDACHFAMLDRHADLATGLNLIAKHCNDDAVAAGTDEFGTLEPEQRAGSPGLEPSSR